MLQDVSTSVGEWLGGFFLGFGRLPQGCDVKWGATRSLPYKAFRVANIASPWCLGFPACFLTTSCGMLDKRLQGAALVF